MQNCGFNIDTSYTSLPEKLYTRLNPEQAPQPDMLLLNKNLASDLGLDFSQVTQEQQADLFTGNTLPENATPFAQAYAGHQFGHFTILGDGRAVLWGEHVTPDGQRVDIQFKGSGRTPYSRSGDGRGAIAPMLREYILSEAMHALGVPTTRSLAVATTGETVMREALLPGAVLTRVAQSHIRVGTFEYAAALQQPGLVQVLLDYTVSRHFPELNNTEDKTLAFLDAVMEKQADLITHWMRVGFIHGVMNTDNVSLAGETIDYGPCAFMDAYAENTVFSSIDRNGRYSYANQPPIAQWNLARLAETLLPLIHQDGDTAITMAEEKLKKFTELYQQKWLVMMRQKLGLFGEQEVDETLATELLGWMEHNSADFTNTFRDLSHSELPKKDLYQEKDFLAWYDRWQKRLAQNTEPLQSSIALMQATNPAIIPRNHNVEEALEAATHGDMTPCRDLLEALKSPYTEQQNQHPYQAPPTPEQRVYQTFCGT